MQTHTDFMYCISCNPKIRLYMACCEARRCRYLAKLEPWSAQCRHVERMIGNVQREMGMLLQSI